MPFMQRGAFRMYYKDHGGEGRPVVLFLHGAGGNHLSWWQQVPAFGSQYRCITADQRGFGQSPDPGQLGPAELGRDALALLDHLSVKEAAIVSQSMGGWAAVLAAVEQPQRFWAVVLANTVGNLSDPDCSNSGSRCRLRGRRGPRCWPRPRSARPFRKTSPPEAFCMHRSRG